MADTQPQQPDPEPEATKTTGQRARQSENIKGMIWVLVIGIGLVVAAYAVMIAVQARPVTPANETPAQATASGRSDAQETR